MKKNVVMLMGAALLLSFSASAKVSVSKYSITINEPVTETNFAAAWAECQKKGGKTPSVTLMKCSDAGLAAVLKIYPAISSLTLQDSPELKSIAVLKNAKLKTLILKNLKSLSDLSPIAGINTLQQLKIEKVNSTNKDLSFCAGLSNLSTFEISYFPASLKTIAGIEKCTKITNLTIRKNAGPLDLAPLANFKKLRTGIHDRNRPHPGSENVFSDRPEPLWFQEFRSGPSGRLSEAQNHHDLCHQRRQRL